MPATFFPSEYLTSPAATAAITVDQPNAQGNWTIGQLYITSAPNLTHVTYGGVSLLGPGVNPDYTIRFGATQLPVGLSIQPSSGVISGVPLVAGTTVTHVYVSLASYPRSALVLDNITFNVLYADTDNRSGVVYGPHGQPCMHGGTPVDVVPFDHAYTCACPALYSGPNCNATAPLEVTVGQCHATPPSLCWDMLPSVLQHNATYVVNAINVTSVAVGGTVAARVPVGDVAFAVHPPVPGLYFNAVTGSAVLLAATLPNGSAVAFSVVAVYDGVLTTVVQSVAFVVRYADTHDASNGPDGSFCTNGGVAVDDIMLDNNFSCMCPSTHAGSNCQAERQHSSTQLSTSAVVGIACAAAGGGAAVVVVVYLALRRQRSTISQYEVVQVDDSQSLQDVTVAYC